jgi:hypothetical protein
VLFRANRIHPFSFLFSGGNATHLLLIKFLAAYTLPGTDIGGNTKYLLLIKFLAI